MWVFLGLFLLLKVPMLFAPHNPEELRDYDHFVRASEGEVATRDFVWIYGPLTPLVYGNILRFLPEHLITVRGISLTFWAISAILLFLILFRSFKSSSGILFASLLATGAIGYPSYSHNHVLIALLSIITVFNVVRFLEGNKRSHFWWAFFFAVCAFLIRPVLMGYGILFGWILFCIWKRNQLPHSLAKVAMFSIAGLTSAMALLYLYYGSGFWSMFVPAAWTINPIKHYPNLHYLNPFKIVSPSEMTLVSFLKGIRMSLETLFFYVHFFVWPGILLTIYAFRKGERRVEVAVLMMVLSLLVSADVLHYGFSNPGTELALTVRGQFFIFFTVCSLLLILLPKKFEFRLENITRFGLLILIGIWSYMPLAAQVFHFSKLKVNPFHFSVFKGIYADPQRSTLLEAAQFVNLVCKPGDKLVAIGYLPGLQRFIKCEESFARDAYAFSRKDWYKFKKGENPYLPEGNKGNYAYLKDRMEEINAKYLIIPSRDLYHTRRYCSGESWSHKIIGKGKHAFRVCWRS